MNAPLASPPPALFPKRLEGVVGGRGRGEEEEGRWGGGVGEMMP